MYSYCSTWSPCSPAVIPLRIQLFKHSPFSIVDAPRSIRFHEIVRRAPENVRSGSADMAGIERMSIAIFAVMLLDWRQFGLDWICRKMTGLDLGFSKIWTGLD
ncbi:hypothetical protein V3481_017027 [Fusarium oxysporum f. sp. vasinfectum]